MENLTHAPRLQGSQLLWNVGEFGIFFQSPTKHQKKKYFWELGQTFHAFEIFHMPNYFQLFRLPLGVSGFSSAGWSL